MKLIGSLTSPYVRKVRIVFAEKKLDYTLILEDVWAADTTIQTHNPIGKVPCLLMEESALLDGALFDSRVIVEYLDTLSPVGRLIPQTGRDRAITKCWEALADGLLDAAVTIVKEKQRPAEKISAEWIARQEGKIHAILSDMSEALDEQSFCTGVNFTLADVAVGCALGYLDLRFAEIDWRSPYPNLDRLFQKLMQRPSFEQTLPPDQAAPISQ